MTTELCGWRDSVSVCLYYNYYYDIVALACSAKMRPLAEYRGNDELRYKPNALQMHRSWL